MCKLVDTTYFASFWNPNNCRDPISFFPNYFINNIIYIYIIFHFVKDIEIYIFLDIYTIIPISFANNIYIIIYL